MERFWRTLRERCLDHLGDLASLHDVQVRLYAFLDRDYHRRPHAGLVGRTPQEVWQAYWRNPSSADRRVDEARLRDAMTERKRRRVRKDSTLSHLGKVWEVDQGYLAGRVVTVAHCLLDQPIRPWVEHQDNTYPLHPVDAVGNSRRPRRRLTPTEPGNVRLDPPRALLDGALGRTPTHDEEE